MIDTNKVAWISSLLSEGIAGPKASRRLALDVLSNICVGVYFFCLQFQIHSLWLFFVLIFLFLSRFPFLMDFSWHCRFAWRGLERLEVLRHSTVVKRGNWKEKVSDENRHGRQFSFYFPDFWSRPTFFYPELLEGFIPLLKFIHWKKEVWSESSKRRKY